MKHLTIRIVGLTNEKHHFQFDIDRPFFEEYGAELISDGVFHAAIDLDKHENFIHTHLNIDGTAKLTCDRSLEPFDHPMHIEKQLIYKFGTEESDHGDDVVYIDWNTQHLDIGQLIYEYIGLAVPMKKIHPRYRSASEEDAMVYSAKGDAEDDPRWDALKKLK